MENREFSKLVSHYAELPPFLTDAELRRIAEPLRQPAAIMRWAKRSGFEAKQKPNGMPLISRMHFEHVMRGDLRTGGLHASGEEQSPDSAALLKLFKRGSGRKVN